MSHTAVLKYNKSFVQIIFGWIHAILGFSQRIKVYVENKTYKCVSAFVAH